MEGGPSLLPVDSTSIAVTAAPDDAGPSTAPPTQTTARPFRSRKQRPCDACRKKKSRCAILQHGSPCVECQQTGRLCTFIEQPAERKPRDKVASPSENGSQAVLSVNPLEGSETASIRPPAKRRRTQAPPINSDGLTSLEHRTDDLSEPCAITALLTDDLLPVKSSAEGETKQSSSHIQISSDSNKPVFFILQPKPAYRQITTDAGETLLWSVTRALSLAGLKAEELLEDYLKYAHPAFPVFAQQQTPSLGDLTPALAALVLAKALELQAQLYPMRQYVWEIIKSNRAGESALREANLASIAICVLQVAARPSFDSRSDYILLAGTIAHAQLLGLHLACGSWKIPLWERELRERLWWTLRIHDAWSSFLNSRPSHVQSGNSSVPFPSVPSYLSQSQANAHASFTYNCRLANIVSRLQTGVCILEKTAEASRNAKIRLCESVEGELTILFDELRPLLQLEGELPGMENFQLLLLGFRCMVHRISIELRIGLGTAFVPARESLLLFEKFVDLIAGLGAHQYDAFWLPYAEHVLSSVLSSLIRLCLASIGSGSGRNPFNETLIHPISLTARLCRAIRPTTPGASFEVGKLALQRAQNVAAKLQAISSTSEDDEYRDLLSALEGNGHLSQPDIPVSNGLLGPHAHTALSHIVNDTDTVLQNGSQTLAPAETASELFWDPNLAFSNLDAWLSALDGDNNGSFAF